jgi:hypothetical protein
LPVLIRVISGGQCQADRSAVSLPMSAATGTGAQPRRHRAAGVDLPRPVLPRAVLRDAVALAARDGVKRMCGGDGADDLLSSPVSNGARQGRRPSAAASENP